MVTSSLAGLDPVCGIAGGFAPPEVVAAGITAVAHRGPDGSGQFTAGALTLGHVRLAVMDPTPASAQPFTFGRTTIVYNGEMWNYQRVRSVLQSEGVEFRTTGDTEVLAALLDRRGIQGLRDVDMMGAVAWTSTAGQSCPVLHVARDPYGEIPLHWGYRADRSVIFASEIRGLIAMDVIRSSVRWLPPGHVLTVDGAEIRITPFDPPHNLQPITDTLETAAPIVRSHLEHAVSQRSMSDVGVTTLISGGIDSSAVLALLLDHHPTVTAYTAVLDRRSPDLKHSRIVCDALGVKLVEVHVAPPSSADLARAVRIIEMPHKAQVELAWPCMALAKRLADDGAKVTFSGEASDELWASYARSYHRVQLYGWHLARLRDVMDQHRKNFARVNKVFMAYGIEARMPFVDPGLIRYALQLTRDAVFDHPPGSNASGKRTKEKGVLRRAFAHDLPRTTLDRNKMAFQTGAGIPDAAAAAVAHPQAFYKAEFASAYRQVST